MLENRKIILQNSSSNINSIKNHHQNHIVYNSHQINNNITSTLKNDNNQNKQNSLKNNLKGDNRLFPPLRPHNSNEIIYSNINKDKIHENIAKKYYNNNNNIKALKDMNQDTKSNYSIQSNSSSKSIKSMINLINTSVKNTDEFSFQEIKCRKYPLETLNSSKMSQDGKYMSTNYSLSHDIQNNLNKELPNQNKSISDP